MKFTMKGVNMDGLSTTIIITMVVVVLILIVFFKGVIKTFQRQPIVAILCIIFLFPIFIMWAIVEMFTGKIDKK